MLVLKIYHSDMELEKDIIREDFVLFLHKHLDQFGDTKTAINKSIDYAFSTEKGKGGFLVAGFIDNQIVGELVMNKTGMSEYIPENILVYVAVDNSYRGKGIGRQIVEKAIKYADGDIKLHVEYDNPAKRLYERIGFTTKYAEMRFIKEKDTNG